MLPRSVEGPPPGKAPFLLTHNRPVDLQPPASSLMSDFGKRHVAYGLSQLEARATRLHEEEQRYQQYRRHILENKQTKVFKSTLKVTQPHFTAIPPVDTVHLQSTWSQPPPHNGIHPAPFRRTARVTSEFSYVPQRIE